MEFIFLDYLLYLFCHLLNLVKNIHDLDIKNAGHHLIERLPDLCRYQNKPARHNIALHT